MAKISKKIQSAAIGTTAIGMLFLSNSCKDKEKVLSKDEMLIGDWDVAELDGFTYSTTDGYYMLFKFSQTGDFDYCYEYAEYPDFNYCLSDDPNTSLKWTWVNSSKKDSVKIFGTIGAGFEMNLRLSTDILTGDKWEGNMVSEYYDDYYCYCWEKYESAFKFVKYKK